MTDDATGGNADRLAALATKVERESRMIKYLLLICTAANIAVTTFGVKVAYDWLPPIMLAHFMEHMQEINMTWRAYDNAKMHAPAAPTPAPAQ
jgi:hypothetical protein